MQVYVENFFRTIRDFLGNTLKRTSQSMSVHEWEAMVRDFIHRHQSQSPFFLDLPTEFLEYLLAQRPAAEVPPFLRELCHYECVELEIKYHAAKVDAVRAPFDTGTALQLSPLARPLSYEWNVHEIHKDHLPTQLPSERTWFILVRNRRDKVQHIQSSMGTHRLLECFLEPNYLDSVIALLAAELQVAVNAIQSRIRTTVEQLYEVDVLISCEKGESVAA